MKSSVDVQQFYDANYFEDGICSGKSCYINYRWMPEMTIKLAYNILKYLKLKDGERVLDYGCAKGYIVKALRILDIDAFGCDISEYAINHVDADVREYCHLIKQNNIFNHKTYNWLMTKDVLEHMEEDNIESLLIEAHDRIEKMFHIIPLAIEPGIFVVPEYHNDPSHIQIQTKQWWYEKFEKHGWNVIDFQYQVNGIKDNWTGKYKYGNGFFILDRMRNSK